MSPSPIRQGAWRWPGRLWPVGEATLHTRRKRAAGGADSQAPGAFLHAYGMWRQPPRPGNRGRSPKPLPIPPPGLLYTQVVKARDHGRIVQVDSKVIFGDPQAIADQLTLLPTSATINTSFGERHNLTQCQSNRRLTGRTNGFSKDLSWFERQLWLSLAYYHLALPHCHLRQPLPEPAPTRGAGSPQRW